MWSLVVATAFLCTLPHSLATIMFPDTVLWNRRPYATKTSALWRETNECKLATKAAGSPEMSIICRTSRRRLEEYVKTCLISGFHRGASDIFTVLGCYEA